ncbi:hypothetical protein OS493_017036 [Desmophyllum pertusum]|uniref:Uncharacterized protein n=1 Tax=Desmophyllum pertusum TaxID=174260 RepID=A0A9W9YP53_9CNID|nr:hypothetical protein OS493_017036 [Desmophyllum pertusum]
MVFRQFEERLVKSAAKLKDESLIKQARSVTLKSMEVFTKFQDILETRKNAQLERLKEREALLKGDCNAISKICQNVRSSEEIDDILTEHAIEPLLQKFEDDVMSGTTKEEALAEFVEIVNKKIKKIVASKSTKSRAEFEQWEREINHFYPIRLCWKLEDEKIPHLESYEELPNDQYNAYWILIPGIQTTTFVAVFTGLLAVEAVSVAAVAIGGGTAGGEIVTFVAKELFNIRGIGDKIKQWTPISRRKVAAWRRFLGDEVKIFHKQCIKVISEETDRIINEAKKATDDTSKQIVKLMDMKSPHNLTKLATDLKESGRNLEEINATFDTMLFE